MTEEKEHLAWVEEKAREARRKYEQKDADLKKLIDEVDALEEDADRLEDAVIALRHSLGLATPEAARTRFRDMTVKAAAEILLREAGGRMRTVDIVKELSDGGRDLGDKAYNIVVSTLQRDDRFTRVDRGLYALVETG